MGHMRYRMVCGSYVVQGGEWGPYVGNVFL